MTSEVGYSGTAAAVPIDSAVMTGLVPVTHAGRLPETREKEGAGADIGPVGVPLWRG